jgi:signal transduction histidine kinase
MDTASPEGRPAATPGIWKTLRFRLAAWNAGVVVVTALLTLIGLRQGVQWALLREVDQVLTDDAQEIAMALRTARKDDFLRLQDEWLRKAVGHKQRGWYLKLCRGDESIVWATPGAPDTTPLPPAGNQAEPWTFDDFRVVRRPIPDAIEDIQVIRVGATLKHVHDDVARIDRWVALSAGAVLLTAPLCGYWLAARAARTVSDITAAASRMRPSHLEERLPIRGSGDELDKLAITINGLLDRIADHLKRKRDFLANAAHELRTPLAAIRSSVEVTLASERSPETYRELLEDIIDEGAALETLVNQLLLISESDATDRDRRDWDVVAFDEIVYKAVDMFRGVAESRDVALATERIDQACVLGNRAHLRQVVNNLLDNAIKYTMRGGAVRVKLEVLRDGETARLCVSDNGAGIDAHDLTEIFDRFFRTNRARSRDETHGAGLGLSICKSVVEAHHGAIRCESQVGHGTTMFVTLPTTKAPAAAGGPLDEPTNRVAPAAV